MGKQKDITGKKYNLMIAIKKVGVANSWGGYYWLFKCDCGKYIKTLKYNVTSGHTKSCGCIHELTLKNGRVRKSHGMSKTRFYKIFNCMKNRCNNKSHQAHHHYGGRGIKVLWNNFLDFKHDMYDSYLNHCAIHGEKQTTIDRINNDLGYFKDNCRWATYKKQSRNKRNTIHRLT